MAKRGCFNPWAGIVSTADQGLGRCKEQKGNCEGLDALCSQNNDGLFCTRQILWFQKENCVDQQRGFLKSFEADTDAEQGSKKG